jgi:thiol-disulfide isomerase/thioredoxin
VRSFVAVAVTAGLLAVAGCSDLQGTDGKDYVGGEGQIVVIEPADREDPVDASGPDLNGEELDLEDYRGRVVVANLWWSGCGPCRREMPLLEDVVADVGDQAVLLGINSRDSSTENALAFVRGVGVDFRSFYDQGGEVLLEFPKIRPNALPSTAVLDREGRLAALVTGEITSSVTLRDVINDVIAEDD